jgi:hypothetical protein
LTHYDMALTTNLKAREILFPILTEAMGDQAILDRLAPLLKNDRPWRLGLLYHAGFRPESLEPTLWLLRKVGQLPEGAYVRAFERQMFTQLINLRRYPDARAFFRNMHDAPAHLLTTLSLIDSPNHSDLGPFAWELSPSGTADVQLPANGNNGAGPQLIVHSWPGPTTVVARKLAFLPPGRYALRLKMAVAGLATGGMLRWTVSCARLAKADLIADVLVNRNHQDWATAEKEFEILPDCPTLELAFLVNAGDSQAGADVSVRDIEIRKLL